MTTYQCRVAASPTTTAVLRQLDATGALAADHRWEDGTTILLVLTDDEIAVAKAHGLEVEVGEALAVRAQRDDVGAPTGTDLASGFVTGYLDAAEVDAQTQALAAAHPSRCTLLSLPHPTAGYDGGETSLVGPATVHALRITADPTVRSRPGFLLLGGTHAREWMNPLVALEFAEQLLANVDPTSTEPAVVQATRIVTEGDVIVVPVLNPDGLNYSIHDDAGWRKNRRSAPSPGSCLGVDDNRNYGIYFGGSGSSSSPCDQTYRGPSALSEPETRNVAWLLEEFPNTLVAVDAHSFGNVVFRPQPGGGVFIASLPVSSADHAVYDALETTFVNAVAAVHGTLYGTGTTSNHAGTSDEHMFFAHRVFAFDTECGTSFQPPWPTAAEVIEEVVAGMRALAEATLDLAPTTPTPLAVVQCVDRTGSMVQLGYDTAARANARRFIDLMSLGDSIGIVSFADPSADPTATPPADRAVVEHPLTLLDDPGDAVVARAAIDGIVFGGWTPIGAGLDRSAEQLGSASSPRAVLLVSDGFENRGPSVASVLAAWPEGLPVHTVALGPSADAALLDQIATQTGGVFHASPTALDLYLVYNQMRADVTDAGLLLNTVDTADSLDFGADLAATRGQVHVVDVEPCADRLTVTLSILDADEQPVGARLIAPSGREVAADDLGVRVGLGRGYATVIIERPTPGRWEIVPRVHGRGPVAVAALVDSPLRTQVRILRPDTYGGGWRVAASARWEGHELGEIAARVVSQELVTERLEARLAGPVGAGAGTGGPTSLRPTVEWTDVVVAQPVSGRPVQPVLGPPTRWPPAGASLSRGVVRLHIDLAGRLPGGATFRRELMRTVRVP